MYAELVAWCRQHMLRPELHLAHPEDMALPRSVDDGPGILQILRVHHAPWVEAKRQKTSEA